MQNYETVIVHFINKQEYANALGKVFDIETEEERNTVMLRYSSVFIKNLPEKTLKSL